MPVRSEVSGLLELALQRVVSCSTSGQKTQLGSSGRAVVLLTTDQLSSPWFLKNNLV